MCTENPDVPTDEELIELLSEAYLKFIENQKPLDSEFAQVLNENIFDLF